MKVRINYSALASFALNVLLIIAIIALLRGCGSAPCLEAEHTIERHSDTVYIARNEPAQRITDYPVPKAIRPYVLPRQTDTVVLAYTEQVAGICSDTVEYCNDYDSANVYRAHVYELVSGNRIIWRDISWQNTAPERVITNTVKETIVQRDKEKLRLYAGAFVGFSRPYNPSEGNRWSIGPSLLLTEPHGIAIGYGFDARNNGHLVNLYYKIKLGNGK